MNLLLGGRLSMWLETASNQPIHEGPSALKTAEQYEELSIQSTLVRSLALL